MKPKAPITRVHPKKSSTIQNGEFVELIERRARHLFSLARFLAAHRPKTSAFSRPLIGELLSQSMLVEELLDLYGARNNLQWCRFRSLVATLKLFAEVSYELLHIHHSLPSYRLLPVDRDFAGATVQSLELTQDVLVRAATWLLAQANRLGLAIPTIEIHPENYLVEQLPPGRLPHDRATRKIKNAAEIVTHLATAYLNLAADSEMLNTAEQIEPKDYATCFPNPISEDSLRYLKVRFHCMQSMYDTYVSETEIESLDHNLPTLRGHISIVFHLLEIATYLAHYYERHLNAQTGDLALRRRPVIALGTLLALLMNYSIAFSGLYLKYGRCFCHTMLRRYAEIGRIEAPVPSYRGFHVRPSTLIARIVQHYGSLVVMELDGQTYDAGSPMDIFRANEKINAQKRRWLIAEIGRLTLPAQAPPSSSEIRALVLDIVLKLAEQSKVVIYQQPLQLSDEFDKESILLDTVSKEIAKLQATGQIDIQTDLNITFVGDKRVLSDLLLLAESGYGEDRFGNNIALPRELAYLRR